MTARPLVNEENQLIVDEQGMLTFFHEDGSTTIKVKADELDLQKDFVEISMGERIFTLQIRTPIGLTDKETGSSINPQAADETPDNFSWDDATLKLFFEALFLNRGKKNNNRKKIFNAVAEDMKGKGYKITAQQVCNKYKSLERTYKSHVARDSKTGRGRKILHHEKEMIELFGQKHNIVPKVVSGRNGIQVAGEPAAGTSSGIPGNYSKEIPPAPSVSTKDLYISGAPSEYQGMAIPSGRGITTAPKKINKRDGKTAMALNALKEQMQLQNEIMKEQMAKDKILLEEIKVSNELKKKANEQRDERNALLRQQINLFKQLIEH